MNKPNICNTILLLSLCYIITIRSIHCESNGECGTNHPCQNGGTCIEGPQNYTCSCPEGFTGPYCSQDINECARKPNVCQNGATCLNKFGGYQCICVNGWTGPDCSENVDDCSTAACEPGATCHDRVGHFYCECPPGKTGLLCQLHDGCFNNPCHTNATCDTSPIDGHAVCICPPGYSGQDCSIDNDECSAGSPCEHGGICVNTPGSFKCECPKGFTGSRCEININECETNPCENDGTCLDEKGGYKCICMPGFTGPRCQIDIDECAHNPCQNGAICKDLVNSYRCLCQSGFWGDRCEFSPVEMEVETPRAYISECELMDCESKRRNGKCDQECNSLSCSFDGGDCLLGTGNPWAKCSNPFACWAAFKNGNCDQECNTAECLYDGNDCAAPPIDGKHFAPSDKTSSSRTCDEKSDYCLKNYANNNCDQECNSQECGWDGGDCEISMNDLRSIISTEAKGQLVITVEPAIKIGNDTDARQNIELARMLTRVSAVTKTILKLQNLRQVDEGRGTMIELIADNRKCQSSCYNNTELIAAFLSALRARDKSFENVLTPDALKITHIGYTNQTESFDPTQRPATSLYIIMCSSLAAVCALLMVISVGSKQKVKEKAIVWFPEGFKPVLSSRNRDPTNRKTGRGVSTLQALGGNFFRGIKRNERNISNDPNGLHSTEIDTCTTATPNGGGIYHEPYDQYDEYGTLGSGSIMHHVVDPLTPPSVQQDPANMEGPHGLTPLMVASIRPMKDQLELISYGTTGEMNAADNSVTDLLQRGAQLSSVNKVTGETALHLAARHRRVDSARALLDKSDSRDVNAKDATGRTPLHHAIAADSMGVFELLIRCRNTDLNAQSNDGTTPLILAVRHGISSMLEELIQNECEVTRSDMNGKTALHWAAATNNVDAIRALLAVKETNKDAQDILGETPLFLAAREGAKQAVELLLNHNANKDIYDEMDVSPMEIARTRQHYDIVRLLEDHDPLTPKSATSLHPPSSTQMSPFSPSYDECQTFWNNNNNNTIKNTNIMSEVYNVPCLKNNLTPSPDSPFSIDSMASPPGIYSYQQYRNLNHSSNLTGQKQAGVFI